MVGALSGPGVRVVLVGTGRHVTGSVLPDVDAVANTVGDLDEALRRRCGLEPSGLSTVVDPAGPHVVDQAVRRAAAEAPTLLLVYYVGHGLLDRNGELYLATTATEDLTRPGGTAAHYQALPYRTLRDSVSDSRARSVVVVLDCCWAARASAAMVTGSDDAYAMAAVRDSYLLTAASRDEAALASPGARHTAFTGALLNLLERGDPTGPPELTLEAAYRYLARALPAAGRPEPRRYAAGRAGDLTLTDNRGYKPPMRSRRAEADDVPNNMAHDPCPYRGLEPFDARSSRFFHGRDSLVADVLGQIADRLTNPRPLIVVGASGAGKTSLLRAGVLPALAAGNDIVPGSWRWPQIVLRPGRDPLGTLAGAVSGPSGESPQQLRAALANDSALLRRFLRSGLGADALARRMLFVVDQFEELFAADVPDSERHAFLDALVTASSSDDGSRELPGLAIVIMGVRADYYGRCADYPRLAPAMSGGQVIVGPMTRGELVRAITKPAAQTGLELEDGLIDVLLRDLRIPADSGTGQPGAPPSKSAGTLPLLSYALLATWQQREGRRLTIAGYAATGGVDQAVARAADEVYAKLDAASRDTARTLLLALISLGSEGGNDTRRRRSRAELIAHADDPARANVVLEAFAAEHVRLITLDDNIVEITHEALLHAWPTLRSWVNSDRASLVVTQRLVDDAGEWAVRGRDPELLYRGGRLTLALDHTRSRPRAGLPATARDYLETAIRASRRRARRSRILIGAFVALVLIAIAAGAAAVNRARIADEQRRIAQDGQRAAVSRQLANQAIALLDTDPRTALRMAVAAHHVHPDRESQASLYQSLTTAAFAGAIAGSSAGSRSIFFPDGGALVTSTSGRVVIWDYRSTPPKRLASFPAHGTPVVSPDGRTVAVGTVSLNKRGIWSLWDVRNRAHPVRIGSNHFTTYDIIDSLVFSPNGRLLAMMGESEAGASGISQPAIYLWDITNRAQPHMRQTLRTDDFSLAFAPDGRTLATGLGEERIDGQGNMIVHIWDITPAAGPALLETKTFRSGGLVRSLQYSRDGRLLIASGSGPQDDTHVATILINVTGERRLRRLGAPISGDQCDVMTAALSPAAAEMATTCGPGGAILIWDIRDRSDPSVIEELTRVPARVQSLAFSPDGHTLEAQGSQGRLYLWHPEGRTRPPLASQASADPNKTPYTDSDPGLAVSTDGKTLVTGDGSYGAIVWDIGDAEQPRRIAGIGRRQKSFLPSAIALSPDGRTVAIAGEPVNDSGKRIRPDVVFLWDINDRTHPRLTARLSEPNHAGLAALSFRPDGRILAVGGAVPADGKAVWETTGVLDLWNVSNPSRPGHLAMIKPGIPGVVQAAAFSPGGRLLAAGGGDWNAPASGSALLLDTTELTRPRRVGHVLTGHEGSVSTVAFAPDGRTLATGGGETGTETSPTEM